MWLKQNIPNSKNILSIIMKLLNVCFASIYHRHKYLDDNLSIYYALCSSKKFKDIPIVFRKVAVVGYPWR